VKARGKRPDDDVVGNCRDAIDPPGFDLSVILRHVTVGEAAQRDGTAIDLHLDVSVIDVGTATQFSLDDLSDVIVRCHELSPVCSAAGE